MRKLWGGAFGRPLSERAAAFGQSIESDLTFWEQDVRGSIAHARMLGSTGIISVEESALLIQGLEQILTDGAENLPDNVEDIHAAVELRLGEIVGDVAGKLHTARSRNDQVATDARLWLRDQIPSLESEIKNWQAAILKQAQNHKSTILPGTTHQQHAQPISLSFHLMAYFWAFQRHGVRLNHLRQMTNASPLGSAALAGTPFPIDRQKTAQELGFDGPMPSALDATSDRSYVLDALHLCALIMLDLSRFANEVVLWTTPEFGFLRLPDHLTTGSSIMPQKRNPDMAELIRGRTGIVVGNWVSLATTMKGLVMGYNRDTQDDKPPLFASVELTLSCLAIASEMMADAEFQPAKMKESLRSDFSTATDLADFLATNGMPFRHAHEMVGQVVRGCIERNIGLEELRESTLTEINPKIPVEALGVLSPEGSVGRKESYGGTGPKAVEKQIELATELWNLDGFPRPYPF